MVEVDDLRRVHDGRAVAAVSFRGGLSARLDAPRTTQWRLTMAAEPDLDAAGGAEQAALRHAPALVAAFALAIVLIVAGFYVVHGASAELLLWGACSAVFLPGYLYLVHRSAAGATPRHRGWILALTAAIAFGLPVIGGLRSSAALSPFVVAAFITLPWRRALGAGVLAILVSAAFEFRSGGPGGAFWLSVSVIWQSASLYTMIWVVRVTRSLHEFRVALAARTLAIERAERSSELQSTLGTALDDLAARSERARALVVGGSPDARSGIEDVGTFARTTLTDARRMISDLSRASVRSELDNARALLAAVGIDSRVRVVGPATRDDPQVRERLRSSVADVLVAPPPAGASVQIDGSTGTIAVAAEPQVEANA